eukprot:TRINITY_DN16532_c0_g2_i1.p1 TRINITY_DN16532_c0_g2~~TRINITY_DN16532_c0_g2_i1.p1  ORF type:complete len:577 (-),score=162.53 TRINITY_DN16532_c0_g2_i1:451-2181(-)
MGFNSVFHSLQELFPQVDVRILKAVAIEHSKDVDAAVESILSEVLPTISSSHEVLLTSDDKHGVEQEEICPLGPQEEVEEANAGLPSETRSLACEVASGTDHTNRTLSVKLTCSVEAVAGSLVSSAEGVNDLEELFVNNDKEEVMPSAGLQEVNLLDGSNFGTFEAPSFLCHEDPVISDCFGVALHSDIEELDGDMTYNSLSSTRGETYLGHSFLGTSSPKAHKLLIAQQLELPVNEEKQDSTYDFDLNNFLDEILESSSTGPLESSVQHMKFDSLKGDAVDRSLPPTIATQSDQIIILDFLEELISNANKNKETLLVAIESVLNKAREVELQEKIAKQAKEEASRVGLDILTEVENVKQMVHQAKETYDMHAGEVFGERAILATEARELQSRLLYLSNEKEKSLSIIDEIHQNLEERLAAAELEKVAAEKEKLEREKSARKDLDEQALINKNVVQDLKKLQLKAEENTKLRELLVDRGRIVDTLQGEITVICEDVKLLKERIDGHLPISSSLSSSQTSTSSNLSLMKTLLDQVAKYAESSDSMNISNQDHLQNGDQSSQNHKKSLDGEWVLFCDE